MDLHARGRLWSSSSKGTWIEDGEFRDVRRGKESVVSPLDLRYDARADRMWMIGQDGVDVIGGTSARSVAVFTGQARLIRASIVLDSAHTAWYANGPERFHDGRRVFALERPLGDKDAVGAITSIFIDREGSVWLGTPYGGLYRLKPSLFSTISVPEGLLSGNVSPVYEDSRNVVAD